MAKVLVGLPCKDTVHTEFMFKLFALQQKSSFSLTYIIGTVIHDARNKFAADAINGEYDRLLMIDSDMVFDNDLIERMNEDMDTGIEYVSGIFFQRHYPPKPCIYKSIEHQPTDLETKATIYEDYPKDQLFECAGTGCGAVMISTSLLKRVWDTFDLPFHPLHRTGEDLSFCWRASQVGAKLYCDSRIKVGHCGDFCYTEETYRASRQEARKG